MHIQDLFFKVQYLIRLHEELGVWARILKGFAVRTKQKI